MVEVLVLCFVKKDAACFAADPRKDHEPFSAERKYERIAPFGDGKGVDGAGDGIPVAGDGFKCRVGIADELFCVVLRGILFEADGSVETFAFLRRTDAAARKAIALADGGVRYELASVTPPVDQILSARMRPLDVSPFASVGVILVEQMIRSVQPDRPVRIVHPIFFGRKVNARFGHVKTAPWRFLIAEYEKTRAHIRWPVSVVRSTGIEPAWG